MPTKLAWLHLSDMNFSSRTAWQETAHTALLEFIENKIIKQNVQIDLIFCTGDIAFGARDEEYALARGFFDKLLAVCGCEISRLFMVPGNRDIDPDSVKRATQVAWRQWGGDDQAEKMLDQIHAGFAKFDPDTSDVMQRLAVWGAFVRDYLPHQQAAAPGHHHHAQIVDIRGRKIGVAGFNSAWTCGGDESEDKLWLAAAAQFGHMRETLKDADLKIGLIHHPSDYFNIAERETIRQRIGAEAQFWLHGHTRGTWIAPQPSHVIVGAGVHGVGEEAKFDCNLVQLDFVGKTGKAHLYRYQKARARWLVDNSVSPGDDAVWCFPLPSARQKPLAALAKTPAATGRPVPASEKLIKLIEDALDDPGAKPFRTALCRDLALDPGAGLWQIMAALDDLLGLDVQMHTLQHAIQRTPIPQQMGEGPHVIECAAARLYMRAAIRAVDAQAVGSLRGAAAGVTVVPEKNEVLIAVLMAALDDEFREIRLHQERDDSGRIDRRARGDALIDLDDAPFYPLQSELARAKEVVLRVDKRYSQKSLGAQKSQEEQDKLFKHIKGRVDQQQRVHSTYFRFIVSQGNAGALQDDAECERLYNSLGIPITKIVPDAQARVEAMLGVSGDEIQDLFIQFLELINDARPAATVAASRPSAQTAEPAFDILKQK